MADKTIGQLVAATNVTPTDLFVLEQNGTAKKLTGQTLENWLVSFADGHGGIQSIEKTGTSVLVDTYTITLADTTTVTFTVTNGKAVSSITTYYAVSTSGSTVPSSWSTTRQSMTATKRYLWSYQHIAFNDGSSIDTVKTVIGVWGDKGDTGNAGRGIVSLAQTSREPGQYTLYTFTMSDGTTETFYSYDGVGITGIAKTSSVGLVDLYTISYSNGTSTNFTVTNAKSITSVTQTGSSGLVDTYTVAFNDGTSTTFTVTNGSSILGIAKTSTQGLVDTYTVSLTDGTSTTFTVTNAKSITSIKQTGGTHAAGTTDTYTIYFNDGDTAIFTVYNGMNGTGSVSTVDGIQPDGNQNVTLLTTGNGAPTSTTPGQLYQRYFDLSNQILYICIGVDTATTPNNYSWAGTGVPVDASLSSSSENPVQNKVITSKVGTVALNTTAKNLSGAVNELNSGITNLNTKMQGLTTDVNELDSLLATYTRPNLLDNPWFQVNQRGKSSYTGAVYGVDRWVSRSNTITVTVNSNRSITVKNNGTSAAYFSQYIEDGVLPAGKYTLSVNVLSAAGTPTSSGNYCSAYLVYGSDPSFSSNVNVTSSGAKIYSTALNPTGNVSRVQFTISAGCSITMKAVKLEIGSVSTLANDIPPGYGEQLARCQRYYQRIANISASSKALLGQAFATTATLASIILPLPTAMRGISAVSASGIQISPNTSSNATNVSSVDSLVSASPYNTKSINLGGTFTQGQVYSVWLALSGYIELSADL